MLRRSRCLSRPSGCLKFRPSLNGRTTTTGHRVAGQLVLSEGGKQSAKRMKRCIATFRPLPNGPRSSQALAQFSEGLQTFETSCTSDQELRQPQQLPGGHAGLDLLHFDSFQASYQARSPPILYPIIQSLFKRHQVTKSFPKSAEIFSPGYQIYQIQRSQGLTKHGGGSALSRIWVQDPKQT